MNSLDIHGDTRMNDSDFDSDCDIDLHHLTKDNLCLPDNNNNNNTNNNDSPHNNNNNNNFIPTTTLGNLQNFIFTNSDYEDEPDQIDEEELVKDDEDAVMSLNFSCDQFHSLAANLGSGSSVPAHSHHSLSSASLSLHLSLMSSPTNNGNYMNVGHHVQQQNNQQNNHQNTLEVPAFFQDSSNQSIQSNISAVSSTSHPSNFNLPALGLHTSVSSTISMNPNFISIDSMNIDEFATPTPTPTTPPITTIMAIPRALTAHILSFLDAVQVIKTSAVCSQFYGAIKDEGAAFECLNDEFFRKIFGSHSNKDILGYFKRFKTVKSLQIDPKRLHQFIVQGLMVWSNDEEKTDTFTKENLQIEYKSMTKGFWSCFNRLNKLELISMDNELQQNELIINTLEVISSQQQQQHLDELILHNICITDRLFCILNNLQSLTQLSLNGQITFENDAFDENQWIYNNFNRLRMNIMHISNISFSFKNMHFMPYFFISLFYHQNLTSFGIQFDESQIIDLHDLMNIDSESMHFIQQKCGSSVNLKELSITPHLFCDMEEDEDREAISTMIDQIIYYNHFPTLQRVTFGDWNGETWISFVSDQDYKKFIQFIINHYQTLEELIFDHNNTTSLLNCSIWEPLNFLCSIFSQQYLFDIDVMLDAASRHKLQFWCQNTLKTIKFQIGETDTSFQEFVDENKFDDDNNLDEQEIYIQQFDIAKYEWLNDIKYKIQTLVEYFKKYNVSHHIHLSFVGGAHVLFAQKVFKQFFQIHSRVNPFDPSDRFGH